MSRYQCPLQTCRAQWDADDGGLVCPVCGSRDGILVSFLQERAAEPVPEVEVGLPNIEPPELHVRLAPLPTPPLSQETPMAEVVPLVAPTSRLFGFLKLAAVALVAAAPVVGPILGALVPPLAPFAVAAVGALGGVAAFAAGHVEEAPRFLPAVPLVPPALAASCFGLGTMLAQAAFALPPSKAQTGMLLVAAALCWAAGKALPPAKAA